jgi:5-methylcytosine-specific restriction endonuclease McrA
VNSAWSYTPDNCVPCCKACNYAKKDRPQGAFFEWARRLSENLRKKGLI